MGGKRHAAGTNKSQDKKRRRDNEQTWKNTRGDENRDEQWSQQVVSNPRFEAFYKAQGFVSDAEWPDFMRVLATSLPACFRINSDYAFADELRQQLNQFAGKSVDIGGVCIPAVQQMDWYQTAYKLGTDRKSIRKVPELEGLHKWLIQHTDCGNITRQEAVSMIPPLALNVQPHHKCLDMCAAPGSKTSQLLEIVNRSLKGPEDQQGLVVANDSDTDRAYMLVHQCRRINSPLLVVTTHRGQMFPKIEAKDEFNNKDGYFDRVLCDVPCSGDGTLRKNPAIWLKWSTSSALSLHPLQMIIAQRGVQLLKSGGLMVYSTCSMSPYEDEAVIAELLRHFKGQLELVDAREFVPVFKARPGLTNWHVIDDALSVKKMASEKKFIAKRARFDKRMESDKKNAEGTAVEGEGEGEGEVEEAGKEEEAEAAAMEVSEEEAKKDDAAEEGAEKVAHTDDGRDTYHQAVPEDPLVAECVKMGMTYYPTYESVPSHLTRKIRKSYFPPTEEENSWMHLERCMRCVPHDEDTGGFFVATLRKIPKPEAAKKEEEVTVASDFNEEDAAAASATDDVLLDGTVAKQPTPAYNKGLIDFQVFQASNYEKIKSFYGFTGALCNESLVVREDCMASKASNNSYQSAKSVYFIPHPVRDFLSRDKEQNLKVVTAGIKVLERMAGKGKGSKADDEYRLVQDGLTAVVPHITTRKVSVRIQDFCNLLGGGLTSLSTIHADTVAVLGNMSAGAVICVYTFDPADVQVVEKTGEATEDAADLPVIFDEVPEKKAVKMDEAASEEAIDATKGAGGHHFYAMCWRGVTRTINVMCGKVEIESMKHQLTALGVLRPKIAAIRREMAEGEVPAVLPYDATAVQVDVTEKTETEAVDVKEDMVATTA